MADKQVKNYDKFNLRFPDGMREAIAERAKRNGRSMNSEIVQILEDALYTDSARVFTVEDEVNHSGNVAIDPVQLEKLMEKVINKALMGFTGSPAKEIDKK